MKFRLGSTVIYIRDYTGTTKLRKIVGFWGNRYLINIEELEDEALDYKAFSNCSPTQDLVSFKGLALIVPEHELECGEVADIAITRKLYPDWEPSEDGRLRIKCG